MMRALFAILAIVAGSAYAQSSTGTGVNGTGMSFAGMVQQDVGAQTVTLTIGGNGAPQVTASPKTSPPGVVTGSMSAGLSIGATLGGGFGSTGGTAGTGAGLGSLSLP